MPGRSRVAMQWFLRILPAAILAMAAVPKLLGAADPVALFTLLGAEPMGRLVVGALEAVAALLLLWPRGAAAGAGLGAALMLGAIGAHLTRLGINYGGGPTLFIMACTVLASCIATLVLRREA